MLLSLFLLQLLLIVVAIPEVIVSANVLKYL
jgi:hypothetical protein